MPNASHRLTKRAALSAESFSRMPPSCLGWLATIPTGRPPILARHVTIVLANWDFRSNHSPWSTMRPITSYTSYGLRFESGRGRRAGAGRGGGGAGGGGRGAAGAGGSERRRGGGV